MIVDLETPKASAEAEAAQLSQMVPFVSSVTIDSPDREAWAVDAAHQIREQRGRLERERDSAIKPLESVVKRIKAWWKGPISTLIEAENVLRAGIKDYRDRLAASQAAALAAAQTHEEITQTVAQLAPKTAGMHERAVYRWEVEDLAKVPREYWILDEKRIGKEVRDAKGEPCIPGIRSIKDRTVVFK